MAGANSSGKSSLTQSLLLLKQTLESSSDDVLYLQGPYVQARQLTDLVCNHFAKAFSIELNWSRNELPLDEYDEIDKYLVDNSRVAGLDFFVAFKLIENKIRVVDYSLNLKSENSSTFITLHLNSTTRFYEIETDMPSIYYDVKDKKPQAKKVTIKECTVDFMNFMPVFVNTKDPVAKRTDFTLMVNKEFRTLLSRYFSKLYYIGPNRVSPVLDRMYQMNQMGEKVDPNGLNTRFILAEKKNEVFGNSTLSVQVNDWMKKLGLANALSSLKNSMNQYRTEVSVKSDLKVDLCNTGFGNSQILPILVQGIMTPANGIFIVEDPEVHMHPSVQAGMADFFIAMAREGKTVMVETHSDHIITRLRRRISEHVEFLPYIHIYFVENTNGYSDYISLHLNENADFKDMAILPKGFMDSQDEDFREIIKNKLKKQAL